MRLIEASLPLYNGCMNEIEVLELRNRLEVAERERDAAMADAERYAFLKGRFVLHKYSHGLGGYAFCTIEVYDETRWSKDCGKSFDYRASFDAAVDAEMERRYE